MSDQICAFLDHPQFWVIKSCFHVISSPRVRTYSVPYSRHTFDFSIPPYHMIILLLFWNPQGRWSAGIWSQITAFSFSIISLLFSFIAKLKEKLYEIGVIFPLEFPQVPLLSLRNTCVFFFGWVSWLSVTVKEKKKVFATVLILFCFANELFKGFYTLSKQPNGLR